MGPAEIKAIIYDLLVELMGTIAIPSIAIVTSLFVSATAAAWVLMKKLVTGPIENLTGKVEDLSIQLVKVETVHGERMLSLESTQRDLQGKHSVLDGRVHKIERNLMRFQGVKNERRKGN